MFCTTSISEKCLHSWYCRFREFKTLFGYRSCAKHWFKNLNILVIINSFWYYFGSTLALWSRFRITRWTRPSRIIVLQFPTQRSVTKRKILEDVVVFFFLPLDGAKEWLCQFVYEMRNGQRNQIRDLHSEFWQNWALHLHDTFMCFSFSWGPDLHCAP